MRDHEQLAARFLELAAAAATTWSSLHDGAMQLAFLDVAAVLRCASQALAYKGKTVDQVCNDLRQPRSEPPFDQSNTLADTPRAKRRGE